MSKTLTTNRPVETNSTTLTSPVIPWPSEYRAEKTGSNVELISYVAPLGSPSSFKFDFQNVKNIYNNTEIDATAQAVSKRGFRVMCQNSETWDVTDSADSTYIEKLPVRCTITFTGPVNSMITDADLLGLLMRTVSGIYDESGNLRIGAMVRGSLTPANL